MILTLRLKRAILAVLSALLLLPPLSAQAQSGANCLIGVAGTADMPAYAAPDDPWIYRGTDIPRDEQWLFGEMPNGLRYAVRQNGVPPCQVSMRIRIDAGSLHEEDSEQGYAHLIEHLTFRQSRHLASGEALPHFQRLGAEIGSDTNAITSPTQTVYQLDLPSATRDRLEESMMLFAGMVQQPALSAENLAMDVPIVLAERRERAGPDMRVAIATRELFYGGQRLAERPPIGTVETLQGATPQSVRAFHQRWYRPENTVVVMVGDASVEVLAAMVERHFSDWNPAGEHAAAPDFGDPIAPADVDPVNPVGETAVIVEAAQPRSVSFAVLRPWEQVIDNMEYNRGRLIDAVATAIITRRLEERARAGGSYLYAEVAQQHISRSADVTFVALAPLGNDWQAALRDVRAVIEDARTAAPSEQEIAREVDQLELAFTNMVEQSRIQAGSQLADDLVGAEDIREAVAAPETFLRLHRSMRHRFTPQVILEHTQALFAGEVIRGILLTPQQGEGSAEDVRAALQAPVAADAIDRGERAEINFADLPEIGTPSVPVLREPLGSGLLSNVERVTFANGVRALIRDSNNEPGRVTVRVRFGAGWRGFSGDEAVYADLGTRALVQSGLASLGQNELDQLATGRRLTFDFSIGDGAFEFEGMTRAEDLDEQLYLFAAKLAFPRWDEAAFERGRAIAEVGYNTLGADPNGILARDLDLLLRGGDLRFATPTPEQLQAADAETFRAVWSRLLAEGPIEVAVFGDIDPEATVAALGRTFGALPVREALPAEIANRGLQFPPANAQPLVLTHSGDGDQAAALIAWPTGGGSQGIPQSRKLEILSQIISNRLLDGMRERYGASYTPISASNWPLDVASGGHVLAMVQLEPVNIDGFFAEADRIVRDLAEKGPSADELARVTEPVNQFIARAQTGHTFWLNRLEGAAFDDNRSAYLPSLRWDYLSTTAEEIRALASRYLLDHGGFRLAIMPQGQAASDQAAVPGR